MVPDTPDSQLEPGAVRDRRVAPTGGLPRHVQAWLMVGTALVIVLIILASGRPQPVSVPTAPKADAPVPARPATVAHYAQELAQAPHQQTDLRSTRPNARPAEARPARTEPQPGDALAPVVRAVDPSLLADNVVLSRRPASEQPTPPTRLGGVLTSPATTEPEPHSVAPAITSLAQLEQSLSQLASTAGRTGGVPTGSERSTAVSPDEPHASEPPRPAGGPLRSTPEPAGDRKSQENPANGPRWRLLEGAIIETVLVTRMNGTFAGPVTCLVTTPVYSADRQYVLIPAGARLLGASAPVQSWGDSRLAVSFHRLLMPDGHTYSLDTFRGLDQSGEAGVTESVNRHYLEVFGASIAIGGLSGLSQVGTTGGFAATSFGDEYRQATGASLASSTSRVLDRYLNVLPTITIREGYRIKVYLTRDFDLPAYGPAESGGVR